MAEAWSSSEIISCLARLIDHEKLEKTTVMGTWRPRLHYTGQTSKESDVYSFGILMLEILCGRRAVNLPVEDPDEDFMLLRNVWRAHEGCTVDAGLRNLQLRPLKSSIAGANQSI